MRRLRRPAVLLPAVVALVLVVAVAAELGCRAYASHRVSEAARDQLHAAGASIALGGTPVLLDLARNRVAKVRVTASDAHLCALSGVDLSATFLDLTLRGGHRVSATSAQVTLTARGLTRFARSVLPAAAGLTVVADPAADTLDLSLGAGDTFRLRARPTLSGDRLALAPVSVTLLGQRVPASALDRFTDGSGLGRDLDDLPMGLTPTRVRMTAAGLSLDLQGGPADLDHVEGGC